MGKRARNTAAGLHLLHDCLALPSRRAADGWTAALFAQRPALDGGEDPPPPPPLHGR